MDMISAVNKCEEIVKISLKKEKKKAQYNELLLKLSETDNHVENLESKSKRLEEENKVIINMVREERENVQRLKEEMRRRKNMVKQEKEVSRIKERTRR